MSLTYSYDEECMRAAIEESVKAVQNGNMPFGGVIADQNGKILVRGHNMCTAGNKRGGSGDVTKHAEVEVVRAACAEIDPDLRPTCTLYASTEPCVMCAGAIYWSRIGRVVYGCSSEELADLTGPGGFDIPIYDIYGLGRAGTRILEVGGPLLSEEAMNVHRSSGVWCTSAETKESNLYLTANKDIELERSLLASGVGAAAATRDCTVPVIDMSKGSDEEVAEELWKAATTCGFFTVVGHGIPHDMIDGAFEASAQFFALDKETKEEQSPFARNLNSGYEYMTQVRPSTGTNDQKESIQVTARKCSMDGRWPSTPSNFREVVETFMFEAHKLAGRLLDLMEPKATPHVEAHTLAKSHTLWADDGQCTLRMLHYPPMDAETARQLMTPDEDGRVFWRAGPHTDWTNLTLLFQRPGQAGLECCANPRDASKAGGARWTPVNPLEGGIAVNIGDMLARWSDGRLYSNLHRVRMPTEEECTPPSSRYSIAFFAQSDKSTLIESSDHEPITAGDYLLSRIKSNFSDQ